MNALQKQVASMMAGLAGLPRIGGSFDDSGIRAVSDPIGAVQRVNAALTGYTLRSGANGSVDVGPRFWTQVPIDRYLFSVPKSGAEDLVLQNTLRPAQAHMGYSVISVGEVPAQASRHTWSYLADRDMGKNQANPWDVGFMSAYKAQRVVFRSLDSIAADLINTTSGTTVYGNVIAGGDWQGNGEMLANVNAAAALLSNYTALEKDQFSLILFNNARQVAENDALFLERRSRTAGAAAATLEDIARYLGVKEVISARSVAKTAAEAAVASLFPDHAVLAYKGDPVLLGGFPTVGDMAWGAVFRMGDGAALDPFYRPDCTSWSYPFEVVQVIQILDSNCAVAITSPS